jgi:hypothetical protein
MHECCMQTVTSRTRAWWWCGKTSSIRLTKIEGRQGQEAQRNQFVNVRYICPCIKRKGSPTASQAMYYTSHSSNEAYCGARMRLRPLWLRVMSQTRHHREIQPAHPIMRSENSCSGVLLRQTPLHLGTVLSEDGLDVTKEGLLCSGSDWIGFRCDPLGWVVSVCKSRQRMSFYLPYLVYLGSQIM